MKVRHIRNKHHLRIAQEKRFWLQLAALFIQEVRNSREGWVTWLLSGPNRYRDSDGRARDYPGSMTLEVLKADRATRKREIRQAWAIMRQGRAVNIVHGYKIENPVENPFTDEEMRAGEMPDDIPTADSVAELLAKDAVSPFNVYKLSLDCIHDLLQH